MNAIVKKKQPSIFPLDVCGWPLFYLIPIEEVFGHGLENTEHGIDDQSQHCKEKLPCIDFWIVVLFKEKILLFLSLVTIDSLNINVETFQNLKLVVLNRMYATCLRLFHFLHVLYLIESSKVSETW